MPGCPWNHLGAAVLHPEVRFGLPTVVSTCESFSILIPSLWFALGLVITQTQVAEERAEYCLDAHEPIRELGSCTILLPWLSTGGPWSYLVMFFPLIKVSALPSGGRDPGLGLEPPWKDRRSWGKSGDMTVVPQRIHSVSLGLGEAAGIRRQYIPFPELRLHGSAGPACLPPAQKSMWQGPSSPRALLSRGIGTGQASPGNLCSQGLPPTTPLLLHKKQQQQKKALLGSGSLPSCFNQGKNVPLRTQWGYRGFGKTESSFP